MCLFKKLYALLTRVISAVIQKELCSLNNNILK